MYIADSFEYRKIHARLYVYKYRYELMGVRITEFLEYMDNGSGDSIVPYFYISIKFNKR